MESPNHNDRAEISELNSELRIDVLKELHLSARDDLKQLYIIEWKGSFSLWTVLIALTYYVSKEINLGAVTILLTLLSIILHFFWLIYYEYHIFNVMNRTAVINEQLVNLAKLPNASQYKKWADGIDLRPLGKHWGKPITLTISTRWMKLLVTLIISIAVVISSLRIP